MPCEPRLAHGRAAGWAPAGTQLAPRRCSLGCRAQLATVCCHWNEVQRKSRSLWTSTVLYLDRIEAEQVRGQRGGRGTPCRSGTRRWPGLLRGGWRAETEKPCWPEQRAAPSANARCGCRRGCNAQPPVHRRDTPAPALLAQVPGLARWLRHRAAGISELELHFSTSSWLGTVAFLLGVLGEGLRRVELCGIRCFVSRDIPSLHWLGCLNAQRLEALHLKECVGAWPFAGL